LLYVAAQIAGGVHAARILKGEKPAGLPCYSRISSPTWQPRRLSVLPMPMHIHAATDEVIERVTSAREWDEIERHAFHLIQFRCRLQAKPRRWKRQFATCGLYLIASSSTSKISVALGGITAPAARSP